MGWNLVYQIASAKLTGNSPYFTLLRVLSVSRCVPEEAVRLPQLARGGRPALDLIHKSIEPDDVCPILPFPALDPRAADMMAEHFVNEIEGDWNVEPGQMIRVPTAIPWTSTDRSCG